MNNKTKANDKSTPYRSFGLHRIDAPNKQKNEPAATKITGKTDLRARKD